MAQKYDTTEFIPLPLPDQDLPNHNQPQACARVPEAGRLVPRPARLWALTPRAGPLQAAGGPEPPRPRGLRSPPAQPCAPSLLVLHRQPSRTREARALSGAASGAPSRVCAAHRRGCSGGAPTAFLSRSYSPAPARFRRRGATPPVPRRTPFPPPPAPQRPSRRSTGDRRQVASAPRPTRRLPAPRPPPKFPGT